MIVRITWLLVVSCVLGWPAGSGLSHAAASKASDKLVSLEYGTTEYASGTDTGMSGQHLFTSFKGAARGSLATRLFEVYGDLHGLVTVNEPSLSYINPTELYLSSLDHDSKPVSLAAGRKIDRWSTLDERWQLGLWQPRLRWNYFQPETNGLTGFFVSVEQRDLRLVLFGSPISIPEQSASFELTDGKFQSSHPFFSPPPSQIRLMTNGLMSPVLYELGDYTIEEMVFNPAGGMLFRLGPEIGRGEGVWGQVSYAYKPMNQILLGYEAYQRPSSEVRATIYPRILYHHLGGLETGYTRKDFSAWLSLNHEQPIRDRTPAIWTTQEVSPSTFAGSGVEFNLIGKGGNAFLFGIDYLRSWGGARGETGPNASDYSSVFESRVPYRDAASITLKGKLPRLLGKRVTINSKATRDFAVDGTLLSAELRYHPDPHWSLGIGAEIAGAGRARAADGGADFLYRYRSNDQFSGGVCYVF